MFTSKKKKSGKKRMKQNNNRNTRRCGLSAETGMRVSMETTHRGDGQLQAEGGPADHQGQHGKQTHPGGGRDGHQSSTKSASLRSTSHIVSPCIGSRICTSCNAFYPSALVYLSYIGMGVSSFLNVGGGTFLRGVWGSSPRKC